MVSSQSAYTTTEKRLKALGKIGDFKQDTIIDYLVSNAETLFIPKKVKRKDDWLATQKEKG